MRYAWNIDLLNLQGFKTVKDYSNEKLYYQTMIEGYCKNEGCNNTFIKSFKNIVVNGGPYCKECIYKKNIAKRKDTIPLIYDYNLLSSLECVFTKNYRKINLNGQIKIEGICSLNDCNNLFERPFNVLIKSKNTFCDKCCELKRREKIRKTCKKISVFTLKTLEELGTPLLKNYSDIELKWNSVIEGICKSDGCDGIFKKSFRTMIEHGGPYCDPCNMKNLREKMRITSLEKYGVENPFQSDIVKDKIKKTCMEKYGVECGSQTQKAKEKMKQTCIEKYGVECNMHVPEFADRCSKAGLTRKEYVSTNGKVRIVQGYEPLALDILLKTYSEDDIITGCKNVPKIMYFDPQDNKYHRYYTDIFIQSENKCIEVKSDWTYKKNIQQTTLKHKATKESGYNCEIWIFNKKEKLCEIIK